MGELTLIDRILEDHTSFREQFPQVLAASDDERQPLFDRLMSDLVRHEVAEEEIVWPLVRSSIDDGDALADMRLKEEAEAEALLREVEKLGTTSPEFTGKFVTLSEMVLSHADQEETEVFPRLVSSNEVETLEKLGGWWQRAKDMAPTHPHPMAPNSAIGQMAGGPVLAAIDRMRDVIRNARSD